jgi:hypothetical protein
MEHIQVKDVLTYKRILGWRGFSFETSRLLSNEEQRKNYDTGYYGYNGPYGIEESDRIINRIQSQVH